jgi:anti-anti-sigma factor
MRHVGETPHQSGGVPEHDQTARAEPSAFEVRLRTQGRTALLELFGELDLATVGQVADAFDGLALGSNGFSHVVLDLRGLTFMDVAGIHELVRQSDDAHQNRHNLAIVRGHAPINRLMAITAVDTLLVLVESPEDLIPPLTTPIRVVLDAVALAGAEITGGSRG